MYPTLNLQFARSRFPDPRITFTRASTGTYIDPLGRVQTAAVNQPRFNWDPESGQCLGLLIEEGRTNSLLYSQSFDAGIWSKNTATIEVSASTGPDGTNTATRISEASTGTGYCGVSQQCSFVAGNTYTLSAYFKAGVNKNGILVFSSSVFGTYVGITFSLENGSVSHVLGSPFYRVEKLPDGWWRASITATATATAPASVFIRQTSDPTMSPIGTYPLTGTGDIYVWGAQLEVGPFPTSYIKTEGAAATRAADTAYVDGAGWLNPAEGTIVVEVREPTGVTTTTNLLTLSNGASTSNRYSLQGTGSTQTLRIVRSLDGTHAYADLGSIAPRAQWNRVAFGYSSAGLTVAANGEVVVNSATMTTPNSLSRLYLGGSYATTSFCWIRKVQYYPVRLSPDELVRITK